MKGRRYIDMMDKYIEHYNERAGILEYDGGHSRMYAELLAFVEVFDECVKEHAIPMMFLADAVKLLKGATGYSGKGNQVYVDGKQIL